ncbi:hypothetical protein KUL25_07940 [Rhodobacteraceae bacterium N5(2021)]|uniref:Uncharacterized protein n=1 Tax=Gymnodinialimonas phycosphaerae TaxID=2841589 RepID=A0A975TXL7_9RHOB|nr:hypothetical protein [Gymnodinialimonas phycosphaerae]MBY4892693.1 hypothetical protein [Gymnodinialimonas phycosphaerae]
MNGTVIARAFARAKQVKIPAGLAAFEQPNGVLAVVLASTIITSVCAFVVVSNALNVQRPVEQVAASATPAADPAPQRRYPDTTSFDTTVSVVIDRAPSVRVPPQLAPVQGLAPAPEDAPGRYTVVEGRPPVMPEPRPGVVTVPSVVRVVTIARNLDAERAMALPRPVARPLNTTTPAWPDVETGPQTSVLLAASSPRPSLRPADLVTRVAARPDTFEIEVARSEAPDSLGGIGESPRPSIFSGGSGDCSPRMAREIPRRPGSAASGSAVMASAGNGSGSGRDNRMLQEALSGNIPSHIRNLQPVTFNGNVGGRTVEVTICVTPDYLAIGSDNDHVRVPLGLPAALRVADAFDMMLPTTTMVDAIYQQADVRVAPSPMTPGSSMSSTNYFVRHNETIEGQFARAGVREGMLVAGHKKDLVLANRLSRNPGRVAIYGWHRTNGRAIQPLSTVHGEYYADYSHGIRLVSRTAFVDGRAVDLRELLTDERYAGFLNSDGALTGATVRLASL